VFLLNIMLLFWRHQTELTTKTFANLCKMVGKVFNLTVKRSARNNTYVDVLNQFVCDKKASINTGFFYRSSSVQIKTLELCKSIQPSRFFPKLVHASNVVILHPQSLR